MTNKKETAPWFPVPYEKADAASIKAVAAGTATSDQQQRALKWIIENVCATYDLSYHPGSDRDTTFAEGKRFVGLQIVKMLKINLDNMK